MRDDKAEREEDLKNVDFVSGDLRKTQQLLLLLLVLRLLLLMLPALPVAAAVLAPTAADWGLHGARDQPWGV